MSKASIQLNKLTEKLPFDQYSRQLIVSRLVNATVRLGKRDQKLEIIDLGGHKGMTTEFQPDDNVTILDIFDESYKNYVKGDATKTNFADNTFDVAVSFDVFEHIPRDKRQAFISEALRISSFGVFLAMPVDTDGKVSSAEVLLNDFYKKMFTKEHPWLKEHIEYKIPTQEEILKIIRDTKAESVLIHSNQVGDWQLMQMLNFASSQNSEITKDVREANTWYNLRTDQLDADVDVGYRNIFFISKDKKNVAKVKSAIQKYAKKPNDEDYVTVHRAVLEQFAGTLASISKKHTKLYVHYTEPGGERDKLQRKVDLLHKKLDDASKHITRLTDELNTIYASPSWKASKPLRGIEKLGRRKAKK